MNSIQLTTNTKKLLSDTLTPVCIYLSIRDHFANSILLESSDYHGKENTFSYICFQEIAEFKVVNRTISCQLPGQAMDSKPIENRHSVQNALQAFIQSFKSDHLSFDFISNGLFGYQAYDAVKHYESVELKPIEDQDETIPEILYHAYRFVIAINHFNNELYLFEHLTAGQSSEIQRIESLIKRPVTTTYGFKADQEEHSNLTDQQYLDIVNKGKEHCQRGDVFQIVLSRRFTKSFKGDDFNVYRALRSVNPSPYLFYFDYGNYKLFGSSPEAQIVIKEGHASIYPIAGTVKRTGDDSKDSQLANQLANDPKENAEHVMLVDLARNDLSRNGSEVKVETFREIQYFSHVIHLVSKVTGKMEGNPLQLVADTFPAGTLSGAPKFKAMELIHQYENQSRGFYGGCLGFLGFNGNFNHAIMIRSFMSRKNQLHYQAGAGIVSKSVPENELEEVKNKLGALRKAIEIAERI